MSAPAPAAPGRGPASTPQVSRARFVRVLLACLGLLLLSLLLSPLFGSANIDLGEALNFHRPLADNPAARVLLYGRLPRVLAAATAGAGRS